MSTTNTNLYDMAVLAEAAYVLWKKDDSVVDFNSDVKVIEALQSVGDREGNFTQQQADYFVANWKVIAHQANTENPGWDNGFSATLFQSVDDPENYVYAVRGTEAGANNRVGLNIF